MADEWLVWDGELAARGVCYPAEGGANLIVWSRALSHRPADVSAWRRGSGLASGGDGPTSHLKAGSADS
jgi:hypothetical protein